jgi:hypothetical protein
VSFSHRLPRDAKDKSPKHGNVGGIDPFNLVQL